VAGLSGASLIARLVLAADSAADLMTPNPVSIREDAWIAAAIALLADKNLEAAPVIDEAGRPVGVLTQGDILVHEREKQASGMAVQAAPPSHAAAECGDETRVGDLMTPALFSVTPETPAARVVDQLLKLNVKQLFVVDDSGALIGVISALDIVRRLRPGG
jgi:CBS domain-containing protein